MSEPELPFHTAAQKRLERAFAALEEFGPQLNVPRLRQQCIKQAGSFVATWEFRHYLNQFALWAPDNVLHDFARLVADATAQDVDEDTMRDHPMFNRGVTHTVEMLAKQLGVTDWVAGDGSEDYDEDLQQTLLNIIEVKGLYSSEDGSWALLHKPTDTLPPGCHCQPGQCMAPRPQWCRDAAKRDAKPDA